MVGREEFPACTLHLKLLEKQWLGFAGEIIPQALCSRFGLQIGAYSAWFVRILLWVVGIISFPISKVLDYTLGSEHGVSTLHSIATCCPQADSKCPCVQCVSAWTLLAHRCRHGLLVACALQCLPPAAPRWTVKSSQHCHAIAILVDEVPSKPSCTA